MKILGNGEIKTAVNIIAAKWSKSAEAAIAKVGGSIKAVEVKIKKLETKPKKARTYKVAK